uniref:Uncharacterized protein n=1 Tax=Bosea sp. NBC_00436 TaxID=2969620 RepID=A0A9E7ZKH8_9HYPH
MRRSFDFAVILICLAVGLPVYFVLTLALHASGLHSLWVLPFIGGLMLGRLPMGTRILSSIVLVFLTTGISREALGGWIVGGLANAAAYLIGVALSRLPIWVAKRRRTVV